jgi:uncharacterized protein YndB with AHSA1/START domain
MLKMLRNVLVVLLILVAVFAGIVALQPSTYHVERSATMAAPPSEVFSQVNDFHKWDAWSPWAKLDPAARYTYEGPAAGKGAIIRWAGNHEVGEGSMTILESRPNELVRIQLAFVKPFEDTATTEFTFKPQGDQTVVTWSMSGKKNFLGKAFCLFMNMDKMIGEKYDEGLANMKAVVENAKK